MILGANYQRLGSVHHHPLVQLRVGSILIIDTKFHIHCGMAGLCAS